eukprot:TRINITY_DN45278_c0_g1_i1.p1 TRINITY_DN45278_c0_g1~~TRINITY_DN45278_c0_g1_i1.p1  ORF type:complete len:248 (-),score=71.03 TRINITY_DN45278_c0_g1_i1:64-807(-)
MSTASPSSTTSSHHGVDSVVAPSQGAGGGEAPQVVPPTNDAREMPVRLHRKRLPHAQSFEFSGASSPTNTTTTNQHQLQQQDQQGISGEQGSFILNNPANQSVDAHALPLSGNEVDHQSCNTVDSGAASPLGIRTRSFMDGIQPIDTYMSGSGTHQQTNHLQQHQSNPHNLSNTSPTTSTSNVFTPQNMSGTPPTSSSSLHHQMAHRSTSMQHQQQHQPATPITCLLYTSDAADEEDSRNQWRCHNE